MYGPWVGFLGHLDSCWCKTDSSTTSVVVVWLQQDLEVVILKSTVKGVIFKHLFYANE
jgi:hypothetical protein